MSVITTWYEQLTRKHREMKRYLQMVNRLQNAQRVEKDYEYLFQLRYMNNLRDHEDLDIQRFIQSLPLGGFLQVVFRLSLNDLRGIRYCHFKDLAALLKSAEVSSNQGHLHLVEKLPEYHQFLVEFPGPFHVAQSRKRLFDHREEFQAGPAIFATPSDIPRINPQPSNVPMFRPEPSNAPMFSSEPLPRASTSIPGTSTRLPAASTRSPAEKQLLREAARQAVRSHSPSSYHTHTADI
jgi:hypothetical protein